jgi:hypothetical protein
LKLNQEANNAKLTLRQNSQPFPSHKAPQRVVHIQQKKAKQFPKQEKKNVLDQNVNGKKVKRVIYFTEQREKRERAKTKGSPTIARLLIL